MNFSFSNLLGAPYRGGNLVITPQDELLTPVGNRVTEVNLVESASFTLPFENQKNVRVLAVSPDSRLLLSIDTDGKALVINRKRKALLHHFSFKSTVRIAKFSPDGQFIAVGVGRLVQVWRRPGLEKTVAPMQLYRTYGHCHADVVALDWSEDGCWIVAAAKDLSIRVFSIDPIEGYRPPTLTGHRDVPVQVLFASSKLQESAQILGRDPPALYTVSRDGALFTWQYIEPASMETAAAPEQEPSEEHDEDHDEGDHDEERGEQEEEGQQEPISKQTRTYARQGGHWKLADKYYFNQRSPTKLTSVAFHADLALLAVGFSHGVFELLQLPELQTIQTLSIGREAVTSLCFNTSGEWLAVGSAALGQLVVWEWRSESYVLKQQGHSYDIGTLAFSPDGAQLVTGGDDNKVKVWTVANGFCFVTFADHSARVSAVAFLPTGHAVLSASMDGTVRAFDLVRYRNFRTLTTPHPVQFSSLAVDPSGDIVVAGSQDTFQIFVWSLKTGRLLDVLAAHEGPVVALSFAPGESLLASGSWDGTVRTWDVFRGKGGVEVLQHSHDVLAIAWRPDSRQLAASTLDGQIYFWDPLEGELQGTIHGRRDIAGGRLTSDRRTAENTSSGRAFNSLSYSADGSFLLAGGSSKYVCVYDVAEKVMLRRFQITHNRSVDGVLDQLNSRYVTDAGPLAEIDHDDEDMGGTGAASRTLLPGVNNGTKTNAMTRGVALAPTGRLWAAATTQGVLLYSLHQDLYFDPTDLAEDVTPDAALRALRSEAYVKACLIALRLGDETLIRHVLLSTKPRAVASVASTLPGPLVPQLLAPLAEMLHASPHVEHVLRWVEALCLRHGAAIEAQQSQRVGLNSGSGSGGVAPALRALQRATAALQEEVGALVESNLYGLRYVCSVPAATKKRTAEEVVLTNDLH